MDDKNELPMTTEEFAKRMEEIFATNDVTDGHYYADELMVKVLVQLGYKVGTKIYDKARKWYE